MLILVLVWRFHEANWARWLLQPSIEAVLVYYATISRFGDVIYSTKLISHQSKQASRI